MVNDGHKRYRVEANPNVKMAVVWCGRGGKRRERRNQDESRQTEMKIKSIRWLTHNQTVQQQNNGSSRI